MMYLGNQAVGLITDVSKRVPLGPGYIHIEYLESSGTQVIDTGINAKMNSKLICDVMKLGIAKENTYEYICGSANPYVYVFVSNTVPLNNYTNHYNGFGNVQDKTFSFPAWVRAKVEVNKDIAKVTYVENPECVRSVEINATSISENVDSHICLFGRNGQNGYERFSKVRIYEYLYYEGDTLLRHMYPAKRESDGELGMYDVVNNVFYTNAGTGTFIGGDT